MEEVRGFFEAQTYNHAKALQKERIKENVIKWSKKGKL